jgi:hypothetical protein
MFVEFDFSEKQIIEYFAAAQRDLRLADADAPEVRFFFAYNCLLKLAQAVCARHHLRVKSRVGHHISLLEKAAALLEDKEMNKVIQAMRDKRNRDLYDGGVIITKKEAEFYYDFIKNLSEKIDRHLFSNKLL